MQEDIISRLLTIAGPLLGVLVGGLITSLTARGLERTRWHHDRQEKLASLKRDALAAALEWMEPMRNAHGLASSLLMAVIRPGGDEERFLKEFPYLLGDLTKKDLPGHQRAVLPQDIYVRGHRIVREIDELRTFGVQYGQEANLHGKPMAGFQECSARLSAIDNEITQLETDLRNAFTATFK